MHVHSDYLDIQQKLLDTYFTCQPAMWGSFCCIMFLNVSCLHGQHVSIIGQSLSKHIPGCDGGSTDPWAAWYGTWLLIKLTPKGVVYSSTFFIFPDLLTRECMCCSSATARQRLVPSMTLPARLSPPSISPPMPSVLVTLLLKMAQSSLLVSSHFIPYSLGCGASCDSSDILALHMCVCDVQ